MYDYEHPAYKKLQEIGREITTKVKPRAVVVFSAHWQGGRDTVEVNTAEITELIYEYVITPSFLWFKRSGDKIMLTALVFTVSLDITTRRSTTTSEAKRSPKRSSTPLRKRASMSRV